MVSLGDCKSLAFMLCRFDSYPCDQVLGIMKYILIVLLIVGMLGLSEDISDNFINEEDMKRIETKHTIVKFNDEEIVSKFANEVSYGISLLEGLKIEDEECIIRSIDGILEKTEDLLEMEKERESKFNINVYDTKQSMKDAFYQTYRYHSALRAWYSFHLNTVFCTVEDIDQGMLAHELGHAIIDEFFGFKPPEKTAEILSKYVDTHLYD